MRKRDESEYHAVIFNKSVQYKFLQGADKYTAIPNPRFLSPVLLQIMALSCAKQMEPIDMLMRHGLLHNTPTATSTHTHMCIITGYAHAHSMPPTQTITYLYL